MIHRICLIFMIFKAEFMNESTCHGTRVVGAQNLEPLRLMPIGKFLANLMSINPHRGMNFDSFRRLNHDLFDLFDFHDF